jgi:hypothetical protein
VRTRGRILRLVLLALLLVAVGLALALRAPRPRGQALAFTTCGFSGPTLVMAAAGIPPEDTLPVRAHEDIHVQQCRDLGWMRMRLKNLTTAGRLDLEAPGYCAGARARLGRGDDYAITRERLLDDAHAMFAGAVDSSRVNSALRRACPELARPRP